MTLGVHAPHTKACKVCQKPFMPARPLQSVCSPKCAGKLGKLSRAKEREDIKRRKQAVATTRELIPVAQEWFNKFVRLRDRDKGCFVCGKPFPVGRLGGDFDAGHVRSRGAAKHLRFNEDNCHGECKECNSSWGAKPHEIEAGAIRRIGLERYEALKNDNTPKKWRKQEVLDLIAHYKARCKELEAKQE